MQSWMIGAVSGVIFVGFWPRLPSWPIVVPLVLVALLPLRSRLLLVKVCGGAAFGCTLGMLYGTLLLDERLVPACVGAPVTVQGRVISLPAISPMRDDGRRQRFEFEIASLQPSHCAGPAKLMLSYYGDATILPGDHWRFDVKLKQPWGLANPGGFNMQAWFAQAGIDAVGSVRSSSRSRRLTGAHGVSLQPHRMRWAIAQRIDTLGLPGEVTVILRALTVADRNGMEPALWHLFQLYGINHLLVISGLHVGLVAGAGFLLAGFLVRPLSRSAVFVKWAPPLGALLLAGGYGALAGFSLPVQRALCMLACFIVAGLLDRSSRAANNLLLAALAVLLWNPLAALGSGFWLSFGAVGAVGALLWLAPWQHGLGAFGRLMATHGFMSLVMLPLGALFFGGGSLVAMLANLLMIPLVGMFVVPVSLLAAVSFMCGWPVDGPLWRLAAWPIQHLLPLARSFADLGQDWIFLQLNAGMPQILLALAAIALMVVPGVRLLKMLALVALLPLLLPQIRASPAVSLDTTVTVLDVGQGTAVVIRSGNRALLYDTGGGDPKGTNMGVSVVLPYLRHLGVVSLDTVVISHPDLDHSAGTGTILNALPVARFRYGGEGSGGGIGRPCVAGEAWRWPGGQEFQFLSPAQEATRHTNNSSCVLRVDIGRYRLLLPGDIENRRERAVVKYWGESLRSDWLLAAHHGSKTSSSPALLKWVDPAIVVISSGYANRFGHPHPTVVERIQSQGGHIYSTASGGALEFELTAEAAPGISPYRQARRRYWM